jgi:hypothetical protein
MRLAGVRARAGLDCVSCATVCVLTLMRVSKTESCVSRAIAKPRLDSIIIYLIIIVPHLDYHYSSFFSPIPCISINVFYKAYTPSWPHSFTLHLVPPSCPSPAQRQVPHIGSNFPSAGPPSGLPLLPAPSRPPRLPLITLPYRQSHRTPSMSVV